MDYDYDLTKVYAYFKKVMDCVFKDSFKLSINNSESFSPK